MNHSTGKPTKAQQARLDALSEMNCIACEKGKDAFKPEIHHLVDKGNRRVSGGHDATIPLCAWHHRGIPPYGWSAAATDEMLGPSLALSKRRFIAQYGTERELLAEVNARLGL